MSAPSIPNLLSLRGARGGARGRRRGGGPASTPGASGTAPSANAIIQGKLVLDSSPTEEAQEAYIVSSAHSLNGDMFDINAVMSRAVAADRTGS